MEQKIQELSKTIEEHGDAAQKEDLGLRETQIQQLQTQVEGLQKEKEQTQETLLKLKEEASQLRNRLTTEKALFDQEKSFLGQTIDQLNRKILDVKKESQDMIDLLQLNQQSQQQPDLLLQLETLKGQHEGELAELRAAAKQERETLQKSLLALQE